MKTIGTLYANKKDIARYDAHSNKVAKDLSVKANNLFTRLDRRIVGGEERFYYTSSYYVVMGRAGVPRWFRVSGDDEFACSDPRKA